MSATRHSAWFIFVTVAIDSMGIGIIMPVMPDLMEELSGLTVGDAALWGGYISATYALMQFLFSPLIGALSDRYGRRPVLLVSLATLGIDYLVMALAPALWLLFLGRALAGISGATYATANAFIADVTPKQDRAAAFGLIGAGFGVGFVLGPAIGGLMGEVDSRAPFYAAALLAFANFAYGWLVLPESLPPERRRTFDPKRANPLGALEQVSRLPQLGWFLAASFLFGLAHLVYPAVWSYFTKAAFDWSPGMVGWSLAAVGVGFVIVQGILIRPILARWGQVRTAIAGFLLNVVGMTGLAMASASWMIFALMPLTALGAIVTPALSGLMSGRVDDNAQGELQGVLASIQAVTSILSPLVMTQLFGMFTGAAALALFPGAPFVAAAVLMLCALACFQRGLAAD